jgi:hypothetical protein
LTISRKALKTKAQENPIQTAAYTHMASPKRIKIIVLRLPDWAILRRKYFN